MPSLENLHQHFKEKPFVLLTVNVNEKKDAVQKFMSSKGYSFTVLVDEDGQVTANYGIRSHPAKFLIDTKGDWIGVASGYGEWDKKEMKSLIELLISSKG
ncbi:MAG: redoxin domain-containing protein [Thermodesulfovibrionia bacterium]